MNDNKTQLDWKIFFAGNGAVIFEPIDSPNNVSVFPHDTDGGVRSLFQSLGAQMLSAIHLNYPNDIKGCRIKVEIEPIDKQLEYGE